MIGRLLADGFAAPKSLAAIALAALMIGCGGVERNGPEGARESTSSSPAALADRAVEERVVLFVGTSLTAGLGIDEEEAFPRLIGEKIDSVGLPYRVVNAGVSGETSAGALERIDWLLRQPFDVLVLETGANDMLRGVPPQAVERNIQAIIDRVRQSHPEARVLLAGMRATPNLGPRYVRDFEAIYPRLAERNQLTFIPFVLEGVAAMPELNQGDGIHPNPEGHRRIAAHLWQTLEPLLLEELEG